jgi:hypothetical protein
MAMIRRLGIVLGAVLVLTGCANPRSEAAARAGTELIGIPKDMLFSCAGVPDRVEQTGDRERVIYVRNSTLTHVDVDNDDIVIGGRRLFRPRTTVHRQNFQCEATFTLHDGVVEKLDYSEGRDLELCGTIVETCVAVVPAPR